MCVDFICIWRGCKAISMGGGISNALLEGRVDGRYLNVGEAHDVV